MKPCSYCGKENEETTLRCGECGTKLQPLKSATGPSALQQVLDCIATLRRRMTRTQKRVMVGMAVSLICIAGFLASDYWHRPKMSKADVIRVANVAAVSEGFQLNEYQLQGPYFEFYRRDRIWSVGYILRASAPWEKPVVAPKSAHGAPGFFLVFVGDRTMRAQVETPQKVGVSKPTKLPPGVKALGHFSNQEPTVPITN